MFQENLRKKSPSPPSRNVTTGSGVLQALGNLQMLQNPSSAVAPERHKTRLDLFVEVNILNLVMLSFLCSTLLPNFYPDKLSILVMENSQLIWICSVIKTGK